MTSGILGVRQDTEVKVQGKNIEYCDDGNDTKRPCVKPEKTSNVEIPKSAEPADPDFAKLKSLDDWSAGEVEKWRTRRRETRERVERDPRSASTQSAILLGAMHYTGRTMQSAESLAARCSLTRLEIDRLQAIFSRFEEIEAVYLFGSSTRSGDGGRDLDLAVVPTGPEVHGEKLKILSALTEEGFDAVDLIFLDVEDFFLRFEAVRPNCVLYEREGFNRGHFYSRVIRQFLDFKPYLERQIEVTKSRLSP